MNLPLLLCVVLPSGSACGDHTQWDELLVGMVLSVTLGIVVAQLSVWDRIAEVAVDLIRLEAAVAFKAVVAGDAWVWTHKEEVIVFLVALAFTIFVLMAVIPCSQLGNHCTWAAGDVYGNKITCDSHCKVEEVTGERNGSVPV